MQSRRAPNNVLKAITSEGLAAGHLPKVPYVAARAEFEPAVFRTEGTEHHHLATTRLCAQSLV